MKRFLLAAFFLFLGSCGNGSAPPAALGDLTLRLLSQSQDNDLNVVFLQRNNAAGLSGSVVAWKVAQNLGTNQTFTFSFPSALTAGVEAPGFAPSEMPVTDPGQEWQATATNQGLELNLLGDSPFAGEIDILNAVPVPITVSMFRDAKVLGIADHVNPGQKAPFLYDSNLYVEVLPGVNPGDVVQNLDGATQLNLSGIQQSADIILTGSAAQGYAFALTPTAP